MSFLVDAQLPPLLCDILENAGFPAIHVDSLPNGDESSDKEITQYADHHNLIVITKDSDFYYLHMIIGQPKKLLLITTGNMKNKELFNLIRKNILNVHILFETCDYVELNNDSLVGHKK
jgi:predicted nuclease of predicted toxin-antitoxin system